MVRKPFHQRDYDRGDERIQVATLRAVFNYKGFACIDNRPKDAFKRYRLI